MNNETVFKVVTKELLEKSLMRYYASGKELKEGDLIIAGYTIAYANLYGQALSSYTNDEAANYNLCMFVLDKQTGMLFQLYSQKLKP